MNKKFGSTVEMFIIQRMTAMRFMLRVRAKENFIQFFSSQPEDSVPIILPPRTPHKMTSVQA